MFGILLSAFNAALGFVFRSVIIKFAVFFGLYFVVSEFMPFLKDMLGNYLFSTEVFNNLPDTIVYYLNLMQFSHGVTICLSAYLTRFIIRRLPVIG